MRAVALIEAHDKTGKAFASAAAKVENLGKQMKLVENASLGLNKAMIRGGDVSSLTKARSELTRIRADFQAAQIKAKEFAKAVKAGGDASVVASYKSAQAEVKRLAVSYDQARMSARRAATEFKAAKTAVAVTSARPAMIAPGPAKPSPRPASGGKAAASTSGPVVVGGGGVGVGGLMGGYAAYSAYQRALDFEREINAAEARGELSKAQAERLRRSARAVGAEGMGLTGGQAAKLGREYVQAGYEQAAPGMIGPTARFSVAGDVEPGLAADLTGSALAAYGIKAKNETEAVAAAKKVQDILARGANISRLNVTDFGMGFKNAAPMAARLGVSMEQLAAMLATQGQAGLRGDEAGIAVRSMLTRMVKPTQDAQQVMAEMGLKFSDYQTGRQEVVPKDLVAGLRNRGIDAKKMEGAIPGIVKRATDSGDDIGAALSKGLIDGLGIKKVLDKDKISKMVNRYVASLGEGLDVDKLLEDLTKRGATAGQFSRIFDTRQGSRLSTLLGEVYIKMLEDLKNQAPGSVDRASKTMTQGAVGAHNRLIASYDNLILTLAESGVLDTVAKGLDSVASGLRGLAEMNPRLLEFTTYAGMAAVALGPITMALRGVAAMVGAGGGGAAAGAAGAASVGAAGRALPTLARRVPYVAGAYAGYKLGEGARAVGQVANGKYWTPRDNESVDDLKAQLAEIDGKISGALSRTHPSMRDAPNPAVDQLRSLKADIENRIANAKIEATVKPDQITAKAEVSGEASVKHDFIVTFNAGLFQQFIDGRIASQVSKVRLHTNGPGSTGTSSPDAK